MLDAATTIVPVHVGVMEPIKAGIAALAKGKHMTLLQTHAKEAAVQEEELRDLQEGAQQADTIKLSALLDAVKSKAQPMAVL